MHLKVVLSTVCFLAVLTDELPLVMHTIHMYPKVSITWEDAAAGSTWENFTSVEALMQP